MINIPIINEHVLAVIKISNFDVDVYLAFADPAGVGKTNVGFVVGWQTSGILCAFNKVPARWVGAPKIWSVTCAYNRRKWKSSAKSP